MNWISAFFSYWLSPVYLAVSLFFGYVSYFLIYPGKFHEIKFMMLKKYRYVRFVAAFVFMIFFLIALHASYVALIFQYYLTVKKLHP